MGVRYVTCCAQNTCRCHRPQRAKNATGRSRGSCPKDAYKLSTDQMEFDHCSTRGNEYVACSFVVGSIDFGMYYASLHISVAGRHCSQHKKEIVGNKLHVHPDFSKFLIRALNYCIRNHELDQDWHFVNRCLGSVKWEKPLF